MSDSKDASDIFPQVNFCQHCNGWGFRVIRDGSAEDDCRECMGTGRRLSFEEAQSRTLASGCCSRCGVRITDGTAGVCGVCRREGYCRQCGQFRPAEVRQYTYHTCRMCIDLVLARGSIVSEDHGKTTPTGGERRWRDKPENRERAVMTATASLVRAIFEAGGDVGVNNLARMSVPELLSMLGSNFIEFTYKGSEGSK